MCVFRKCHSNGTAVLSVLEDLLTKSDQKPVSKLALLDLSSAFDTLDYAIQLRRRESTLNFRSLGSSIVLVWVVVK